MRYRKTLFQADFYSNAPLDDRPEIGFQAENAGINLDNYVNLEANSSLLSAHKLLIIIGQASSSGVRGHDFRIEEIHPNYKSKYHMVIFLEYSKKSKPTLFSLKPSTFNEVSVAYGSFEEAFLECHRRAEAFGNNTVLNNTEVKTIVFSPEHKQAGLQILNYFQETLNQKYLDNDVTVRIGQKGNTVTMEIDTPDGETELYEEALADYSLVVTGKKPVEQYLSSEMDQMALQFKVEMAMNEVKWTTKLSAMKDQVIETQSQLITRQEKEIEFFREEFRLATRANRYALKELSIVAKTALEKNDPVELFKWMDRVLSDHGSEALEEQIESTREEDPNLYQSILTRANSVVDGAATKVMSAELLEFLQNLSQNT